MSDRSIVIEEQTDNSAAPWSPLPLAGSQRPFLASLVEKDESLWHALEREPDKDYGSSTLRHFLSVLRRNQLSLDVGRSNSTSLFPAEEPIQHTITLDAITRSGLRNHPGRVCIITGHFLGPSLPTETAVRFYALAQLLAEKGFQVTVLYASQTCCAEASLELWQRILAGQNIQLIPLPLLDVPVFNKPQQILSYAVRKWLSDHRFDCLHFSAGEGLAYYSVAAKQQGLALNRSRIIVHLDSLLTCGRSTHRETHQLADDLILEFMQRESIVRCDTLVASDASALRPIRNLGWTLPRDVALLASPLPREIERYSKSPNTDIEIRELVVVRAGELPGGLELFCRALDIMSQKGSCPRVVSFVGDLGRIASQSGREYLMSQQKQWDVTLCVHEDWDYLRILRFLVTGKRMVIVPSVTENLPLIVEECLSLGLPFLASRTSAANKLSDDSLKQCLFDASPQALAKKLEQILQPTDELKIPRLYTDTSTRDWLLLHDPLSYIAPSQRDAAVSGDDCPLISVCVIHRNRPKYLRRALESLLHQDYPNFEVILIDDGSDQAEALAFIESVSESARPLRISVHREEQLYPGAARNHAAARAQGKYLVFFDDDNMAKPEALSTLVKAALRTQSDIVTCGLDIFDEDIDSYEEPKVSAKWLPLGRCVSAGFFENCFGDAFSLIKRDVFLSLGGFSELAGLSYEDWELFARACLCGYSLEAISEPLLWYQRTPEGLSRSSSRYRNHLRVLSAYLERAPEGLEDALRVIHGRYLAKIDEVSSICTAVLPPAPEADRHFRAEKVLYCAGAVYGDGGIAAQHQCTLTRSPIGLNVSATGDDPILLLPSMTSAGDGRLSMRIEITSPGETILQLFFRPPQSNTDGFEGKDHFLLPLRKGRNTGIFEEKSDELHGALRLDPGQLPGDYVIHLLEVRESPRQDCAETQTAQRSTMRGAALVP